VQIRRREEEGTGVRDECLPDDIARYVHGGIAKILRGRSWNT